MSERNDYDERAPVEPPRHSKVPKVLAAAVLVSAGLAGVRIPVVNHYTEEALGLVGVDPYITQSKNVLRGHAAKSESSPSADASDSVGWSDDASPSESATADPEISASTEPDQKPTKAAKPDKKPVKTAESCVARLPLDVKLGQKLMVGLQDSVFPTSADIINRDHIGGVAIFKSPANPLDGSIKRYAAAQDIPLEVAIDQEGGSVQRFKGQASLPSATEVARTMSPQEAKRKYLASYRILREAGITTILGPVLDVHSTDPKIDPLPTRMYGTDPQKVASYDRAVIEAAQEAGLQATEKHYPGLGMTHVTTDELPQVTKPIDQLGRDRLPYKILKQLGANIMISNAVVPNLTHKLAAVFSPEAVALARKDGGTKDTVIISDSLTAHSIKKTLSEAVVAAWEAGIDEALYVNEKPQAVHKQFLAIIKAAHAARKGPQAARLSDKKINSSVLRIFRNKHVDPCSVKVG